MIRLGYGGGAIADYPWHLDGSRPWSREDIFRSIDCLRALRAEGISVIDTAHRYGDGMSERTIGSYIGSDSDFDIFTKIELGAISEMKIKLDLSRQRLKKISGILIHNPNFSRAFSLRQACRWLVENWLETGSVLWIGFSTEPAREAERYYKEFGLNAIQVPYSETDRRAEHYIFPWITNEFVMVNRVLGGPSLDGKCNIQERLEFIRRSQAPIDVALVGTTNLDHLKECACIFRATQASSNFGRME